MVTLVSAPLSNTLVALKRDPKLWRLILLHVRDGVEPDGIKQYDESLITYNSALLVNGGFVDGHVIENGTGHYASVVMLQLTNEGHDLLERLETEAKIQPDSIMSPSQHNLSIFISHSSKDENLATALVALLRSALNLPAAQIRCTSVNGFRLPVGTDTEDQLRREVRDARAFIGLITPHCVCVRNV